MEKLTTKNISGVSYPLKICAIFSITSPLTYCQWSKYGSRFHGFKNCWIFIPPIPFFFNPNQILPLFLGSNQKTSYTLPELLPIKIGEAYGKHCHGSWLGLWGEGWWKTFGSDRLQTWGWLRSESRALRSVFIIRGQAQCRQYVTLLGSLKNIHEALSNWAALIVHGSFSQSV